MSVAQIGAVTTITDEERAMLKAGIQYAALMRAHFPDVYISRVAARKLRPAELAATAIAFLGLAHTRLLALDLDELPMVTPKDPTRHLASGYWSDAGSRVELRTRFAQWLELPLPKVYGLGSNLDQLQPLEWRAPPGRRGGEMRQVRNMSRHGLALALWRLVSEGPWSILADAQLRERAELLEDALARAVLSLTPLTPPTPLNRLCARLDKLKPGGVARLGSILAYVCGKTGNPYADWSPAEIRERYDQAIDFDWRRPADVFAAERQRQQQARTTALAYGRLDRRVHADPTLLGIIARAIYDTARELLRAADVSHPATGEPYDPTRLSCILEPLYEAEDPAARPIPEAPALAAPAPHARAARGGHARPAAPGAD